MSEAQVPKPGPHLSTVRTETVPQEPFRELAKRHARRAAELADLAELHLIPSSKFDQLVDLAQAHAAAAEACAAVAPVARQRLIPAHPATRPFRSTLGDPVCPICGASKRSTHVVCDRCDSLQEGTK